MMSTAKIILERLQGNLNSGRNYLITAVLYNLERQTKRSDSKTLPEIMPTTV